MGRHSVAAAGTSEQHQKKIMKNSHPSQGGRTLIQRIEIQMDKRRKTLENLIIQHGQGWASTSPEYNINRGRYEGLAAALALLRSSSVPHEISRSNERLGIE